MAHTINAQCVKYQVRVKDSLRVTEHRFSRAASASVELDMDEGQESLDQAGNSEDVMGSVGVAPEQAESTNEPESGAMVKDDDPLAVKKRLGMQAKKHQREMRAMQEQIAQMQAMMGKPSQNNASDMNPYAQPETNPQGMSIEEQIQRGVRFALEAKERQEAQAREAERMAHVHKQYQRLNNEFDQASEKYDDFDEVVRGEDAPFTQHVRDALLLVDNPSEVAYKLGKNRDELQRISKLHPLDQAREINKLSFALMGGNKAPAASGNNGARPMGNIKANPVNSQAGMDKSPSAIRARMKAGTWK